ncbi:hypothetical protein B0H12DRAFT_589872 [Mycena haematopus]|nr:hypothetical protein B0H12DRAFT_589872 [Mycena haematopus]
MYWSTGLTVRLPIFPVLRSVRPRFLFRRALDSFSVLGWSRTSAAFILHLVDSTLPVCCHGPQAFACAVVLASGCCETKRGYFPANAYGTTTDGAATHLHFDYPIMQKFFLLQYPA